MRKILKSIFVGLFLAVATVIYPYSALQNAQATVSFNPIQAAPAYLSGAGITSSATSITLTAFVTRQGTPITTTNLGGIGYATIDPGTSKEENVSFTGITQNSNGTAVLTGVTRGLLAVYPYTSSSTLSIAHSGGATVITSNSAAFYSQFNIAANTSTITGVWTFASSSLPSVTTDTSGAQIGASLYNLATVGYTNSVASSGAPDAGQGVKGLVSIATSAQIASGTATTTDGAQTLWNVVSAGQYGKTYGAAPTIVSPAYGSATGTASTTITEGAGTNGSFMLPSLATQINGHTVSSSVSVIATIYGAAGGYGGFGQGNPISLTASLPTSTIGAPGATIYFAVGTYGGSITAGQFDGNPGLQSCGDNGSSKGGGGGGSTWLSTTNSIGTAFAISGGGGGGAGVLATQSCAGGAGGSSYGGAGGTSQTAGKNGTTFTSGLTGVSTSTIGDVQGSISIVYTFNYNDPTESVTSTVSGTNYGGTVTVNASTTHLNPTTSTINFATWNFPVTNVSCTVTPWTSGMTTSINSENSTTVQFLFSSAIAGNKYDYNCQPR